MEADFWYERWQNNQTAFHLDQVNPVLKKFYPSLALNAGDRVFVPLCGASHDLPWLVEQGHEVVGVELSEVAVAKLFTEHSLSPTRESIVDSNHDSNRDPKLDLLNTANKPDALIRWQAGNLTVYQGDIFALTAQLVGDIAAVYDRAALIALPKLMRQRYLDHLNKILSMQRRTLLVTLEYDPAVMSGPPFPILEDDVQSYFASDFAVEQLSNMDILERSSNFQEKGHKWIREPVYLIQPA